MKKLTFLLIFISQVCFGQSNTVSETISEIEFDEDTVKCVFKWIANNIRYDVKKLNAIKSGSLIKKNSKFKTEEEYKEYLLRKVIKQKKGICEDYSLLFKSILDELGYESFVIEGYTKTNGRVNRKIGHAWNAVKVNKEWRLYDLTWAAGVVEDGKRFVKNYNEQWYDTDPQKMVETHMPFDPVWQLLSNPITYEAFEKNTKSETLNDSYPFNNLIADFIRKENNLQMKDQLNRSREMGDGIRLITKWRKRMTKSVGLYGITSQKDLLDEATENSNEAVDLFNEYVKAKNKQFKGKKWTLEKAKQNLENAKDNLLSGMGVYKSIEVEDKKATNFLNKAIRQSEKLLKDINKELTFLEKMKQHMGN